MARICIVTPGQLGSNPRVVKEAEALTDAGHAVTVICTKVADFVEPRDQAVLARARFAVRRLAFDRPVRWRMARLRQMAHKQLFRAGLDSGDRALSAMTPHLTKAAFGIPADLYIAHYLPALPAAAEAARRRGGAFAFDAEDFHPGDLPDDPAYNGEQALIAAIEGRYLPKAGHVTAASPLIAKAYAEAYNIALPVTVLNAFASEARLADDKSKEPTGRPSVYWFSQTLGPGRGIETLLEAAARSKSKPSVHLRGTPTTGYDAHLVAMARQLGMSDRLHLLAPCNPADLEREGAAHDVGYVGELDLTRNRQIALTNKLFSYLASGLAIVASDIAAHREIAGELGSAARLFELRDPDSLAEALDYLLLNRDALAAAKVQARHLAKTRFCWEAEKHILIDRVERTLSEQGISCATA